MLSMSLGIAVHFQDPKKFSRVRELLHLQQEIAAARKASTVRNALWACSCCFWQLEAAFPPICYIELHCRVLTWMKMQLGLLRVHVIG